VQIDTVGADGTLHGRRFGHLGDDEYQVEGATGGEPLGDACPAADLAALARRAGA
jgi:hypothetical protein